MTVLDQRPTSAPPESRAAELVCEDLGFRYPGASGDALTSVRLHARPGTITALVGPSGCGKTTLLKLVGGILRPTSGTVHVDGVDTTTVPLPRRRVGWVPQQYALFEHLDVTGNVAFGLRAQRMAAARRAERVAAMLDLCDITDLAHRPVADLSGGQRQRVAIARALAPHPRLLLLDEPLAALDPQLRVRLRAELAALVRASGVTTLLVTHDQDEALALADQLVLLREGRLVQAGDPVELWDRPVDAWAAQFLGHAVVVAGRRSGRSSVRLTPGLEVTTGEAPQHGDDVRVALRWTDLTVRAPGATDAGEGPYGAVETAEFAGDRYRLTVRLADGPTVPAHAIHPVAVGATVVVRPSGSRPVPVIQR